ncbi:membrane protein [Microbacterium phage DesireeRose]|nr:membrane protein [Microbacterium phage MuffinTheCat]QWY84657.2 membrane protein [Microbacterium phage Badulia]UJQ86495.2 membrane protein [Microbacterium phage DesireeRose]WGH20684.1 membrane protein [Microbacterium phage SCoupsA]
MRALINLCCWGLAIVLAMFAVMSSPFANAFLLILLGVAVAVIIGSLRGIFHDEDR